MAQTQPNPDNLPAIAFAQDMDDIEVRRSGVHGQGVFALRDLRQGQVIGHYTSRRFAPDEFHPGWNDRLTHLLGCRTGPSSMVPKAAMRPGSSTMPASRMSRRSSAARAVASCQW